MTFTILTSFAAGPHAAAADILAKEGCDIRHIPPGAGGWTPALIAEFAGDADGWLGTFPGLGLPRALLECATRTRIIVSPIIGTDFIDMDAATDLGIPVAHGAMAENFDGMAEAGVMLIAALRKQLAGKLAALAQGRWKPVPPGQLVRGSTIGIVGFGRIGQGVACRLQGWDCTVIAHDPYLPAETAGVELVPLDMLLARADLVVLLVTLTDETRNLIDAAAIARMKPGAYLINIGRGGVIDEAALLVALDKGHLAGAAIDTWETEPLPLDHPLRNHPKVIATAHVVGHSEELYARMPEVAAENMLRGLRGEEPLHVANLAVLPRWRARLAEMEDA